MSLLGHTGCAPHFYGDELVVEGFAVVVGVVSSSRTMPPPSLNQHTRVFWQPPNKPTKNPMARNGYSINRRWHRWRSDGEGCSESNTVNYKHDNRWHRSDTGELVGGSTRQELCRWQGARKKCSWHESVQRAKEVQKKVRIRSGNAEPQLLRRMKHNRQADVDRQTDRQTNRQTSGCMCLYAARAVPHGANRVCSEIYNFMIIVKIYWLYRIQPRRGLQIIRGDLYIIDFYVFFSHRTSTCCLSPLAYAIII